MVAVVVTWTVRFLNVDGNSNFAIEVWMYLLISCDFSFVSYLISQTTLHIELLRPLMMHWNVKQLIFLLFQVKTYSM